MTEEAIEIQAKAMGWVPQEDFKGNVDMWKDAESFVKDGYEILPILRERTKNLSVKFDEVNTKLANTEGLLKTLTEHHKKTDKRAYERAMADLKAEQRRAVEDNDLEKFDKVNKEIADLDKPEEVVDNPQDAPEFKSWKGENSWYSDRVDMAMFADSIAEYVKLRNPLLKGKAFYDKVTEEVKVKFPNEFENPNRTKADAVEGSGSGGDNDTGGSKGKKKTYNDMPQDAKDACDNLVRGEIMKKDQFVKEYWELEND